MWWRTFHDLIFFKNTTPKRSRLIQILRTLIKCVILNGSAFSYYILIGCCFFFQMKTFAFCPSQTPSYIFFSLTINRSVALIWIRDKIACFQFKWIIYENKLELQTKTGLGTNKWNLVAFMSSNMATTLNSTFFVSWKWYVWMCKYFLGIISLRWYWIVGGCVTFNWLKQLIECLTW